MIESATHLLAGQVDPGRLRRDVDVLAARPRSRVRAPEAMAEAERHVTQELSAAGWQVERQPFDLRWQPGTTDRQGHRLLPLKLRLHRRLTGANLLARLPGHPQRPTVLIGAHLDSVDQSPGADDNASGVAVLLEAARLLGALEEPPPVTLMCFDMEELGLIGSRYAARQFAQRPGQVAGMICLESVGYFAPEPGGQRLPAGFGLAFPSAAREVRANRFRGDFTLVVHRRSTQGAAALWQRAAGCVGPALPALPSIALRDRRPQGPSGLLIGLLVPPANHLGRSDHASFWNRRIPALMLTSTANFRNRHYHRPTDTADLLDYDRLGAVTAATAATALHWPSG
ncbi:M28 family peptidase [Streptomyces sp. NPDC002491]